MRRADLVTAIKDVGAALQEYNLSRAVRNAMRDRENDELRAALLEALKTYAIHEARLSADSNSVRAR